MPRYYNVRQRRKVKANQSELSNKYLALDQFVKQESPQEKMDRFFKSFDDSYHQPSQNQVLGTHKQTHLQQTDDRINAHSVVQSKATVDDAYHAKIDYHFERLESICKQQLQPLQHTTDTPTKMTDTPSTYAPSMYMPTTYTPSMCMPTTYTPINYPSHPCTFALLYSGYGYSHLGYNYGVYQGETDNDYNHTDHEHCNKYVADV